MDLTPDWKDKSEEERITYLRGHVNELIRLAKINHLGDLSRMLGVDTKELYQILKEVYDD